MVCEDDDPTGELLCDQLTADRYRALPAPSAWDALRLCGYNHPDLMRRAPELPDAQGHRLLRQIRSSRQLFDPDLPVLVLSERTSEATACVARGRSGRLPRKGAVLPSGVEAEDL